MSKKRVLPALLLAGTIGFLGVHRLYAGRYVTGALQCALFAAGMLLIGRHVQGALGVQTIEEAIEWAADHPVNPLHALLVLAPCLWAIIDCFLLLARRFRDGKGELMMRWI